MKLLGHLALLSGLALSASAQQGSTQPIGEVFASDVAVRGSIVLAASGTRVLSGSHIEAGDTTALLRLTRGGEVRICPKTGLAISNSSSSPELLLGMNTGAIEAKYQVGAYADSIITPDFRLQLVGPGAFHVAVGTSANGDACIRSLEGNSASVIVTEMLGSGTYQVRAGDSVTFRGGKLSAAVAGAEGCGCPAPPQVVGPQVPPESRAEVPPPALLPQTTNPVPLPTPSAETHVEFEAPLVFQADPGKRARDAIAIAQLRTRTDNSLALQLAPRADASVFDPPRKKSKKRNVFARVGTFFSKIFR